MCWLTDFVNGIQICAVRMFQLLELAENRHFEYAPGLGVLHVLFLLDCGKVAIKNTGVQYVQRVLGIICG